MASPPQAIIFLPNLSERNPIGKDRSPAVKKKAEFIVPTIFMDAPRLLAYIGTIGILM
jgi:hypothetical protein